MGWLNTMLDLTSVTIDIANYQKISQLQQMAGDQQRNAAVQAILQYLKQEVFRYRQAAEEILSREDESQLVTAGAMKLLETNLEESPITPDLFPDLSDKDYVANTIRLIHSNSTRLMGQLNSQEKGAVYQMIQSSKVQADTSYYIENYSTGHQLINAKETYELLKDRNGTMFRNGIGFAILIGALVLYAMLASATSDSFAATIITLILVLVGAYFFNKYINRKGFQQAKRIIKQYDDEIDLPLFLRVDREVNGNLQRAREVELNARNVVDTFFADKVKISSPEPLLPPQRTIEETQIPIQQPIYQTPPPANTAETISTPPQPVESKDSTLPQPTITPAGPKFCSKCGEKTIPGAAFCANCGNKIILQ